MIPWIRFHQCYQDCVDIMPVEDRNSNQTSTPGSSISSGVPFLEIKLVDRESSSFSALEYLSFEDRIFLTYISKQYRFLELIHCLALKLILQSNYTCQWVHWMQWLQWGWQWACRWSSISPWSRVAHHLEFARCDYFREFMQLRKYAAARNQQKRNESGAQPCRIEITSEMENSRRRFSRNNFGANSLWAIVSNQSQRFPSPCWENFRVV